MDTIAAYAIKNNRHLFYLKRPNTKELLPFQYATFSDQIFNEKLFSLCKQSKQFSQTQLAKI